MSRRLIDRIGSEAEFLASKNYGWLQNDIEQGVLFSTEPYRKRAPMPKLKRFLSTKPDFVRLLNALFAVLVAFEAITVTTEQFAIVVLAVEALFQYLSKLAFAQDVEDLAAL